MELVNDTDLAVDRAVHLDAGGGERFTFAAKAAFSFASGGKLVRAENLPLSHVEVFAGEPGQSSLLAEAELGPPKPATDVVLLGSARSPAGGATSVDVKLTVAARTRTVRVFGKRHWLAKGRGVPSDPEPFDEVALIWENAFGGEDMSPDDEAARVWEPSNPIGRGLVATGSKRDWKSEPLPNLEDPSALIAAAGDRPRSAGVGFVARHWEPRRSFAGTYDDAWRTERMPLLPADFDPRHHQAAPPAQIVPRLVGGEPVRVEGVTRGDPLTFKVPRPDVRVRVATDRDELWVTLAIDTLVIDADRRLVWVLAKGDVDVHGRLDDLVVTQLQGGITP
jgi:hypothetical protein